MLRSFISLIKLSIFLTATTLLIPIQALWLLVFSKTPYYYIPLQYHEKLTCFIFNIQIDITGDISTDRQTIFVANHLSYADIIALGSFMKASFIAKADVRQWPLFGILAKLSKTVFVERTRDAAPKAIASLKQAIEENLSLIIFPEGTSTKGIEVYPFKSSLFELFLNKKIKQNLIIQPVTLKLIGVNGHTIRTEADHDLYAWYGDMTLLPHLWALGKSKGAHLEIIFHPIRAAANYDNRKTFAADCHADVAKGLAIKQNEI